MTPNAVVLPLSWLRLGLSECRGTGMHEQLELMMMAAIFPSQPFEETLLLLSWKRLTSLVPRPRSRTSDAPSRT